MHAVTWLTIAGAFVLGMVLSLLGSIKLELGRRLKIGETRTGGLLSVLHLTLIPLMLLGGLLLDRLGIRFMILAGCLFTGAALYTFTASYEYRWTVAAVALLGAGAACLSPATIVLMPDAFFGSDHVGASLNLGNVFFALGALITPTLVEVLLLGLGFRRAVISLGLLALVPAVIALFVSPEWPEETTPLGLVFRESDLWLAGIVFALYMPIEYFLSTWTTTFLTYLGHREERAAWLLSGFWLAFLAGRVAMAFAEIEFPRVKWPQAEPWVIVSLAFFATVALGNLAGTVSRNRAGWGLILLGLLLGPIFPTLVSILFNSDKFAGASGTAYGAMFAIGSTGSFVLPPIIGAYARRTNIQHALRIPLLLAVGMFIAAVVLSLVTMGSH
jgi:MFS family permease